MNKKTILAVICFLTISTPCLAEITTDGTVGPKGQLSGPQFHIGQELGSLRGNNLFHSFGRFNLNSSESATFTGNSHIQNVISRVTGGALSSIDGTLKSEIGSAAFYFINPAGIVFGQHTQIDVPGAFYASTAGELKFADGSSFSAVNPQGNTLSMAAPDAFGFLGKQTGAIALNGAELVFKPGAAVHLSAGKITMDKASLTGEGMDLQLASVGTEKQDVGVASLPDHALAGAISINDSVLDASGNGKGRVAVRAGDVDAVNSKINANNMGNLDMPANQGIDMRVGDLSINNTSITNDSTGIGKSGTVNIDVQKKLSIVNGGRITSNAIGSGNAGAVSIKAESILINQKNSTIRTGIFSRVEKVATGNAGTVNINAKKDLEIINSGIISTSTLSNGKGGKLIVNVGKQLTLRNGGLLASSTFGNHDAGEVFVNAGKVLIDNQNSENGTGIISQSAPEEIGSAGTINVNVKTELKLLNTGVISSDTFGDGNAGTVNVNAESIVIKGQKNDVFTTGISSSSLENATGTPGSVNITATKSIVMSAGDINIRSEGFSKNPGKTNVTLTINTPRLNLSNDSLINSAALGTLPASPIEINTSQLSMDSSFITTAASKSDGGPITINAKDWAQLKNSQITTSVGNLKNAFGTHIGNGGDININTDVLVLDTGFIQANTNATNASGGDINLNVKQLVASRGNLQSGGNTPLTFTPNSGINVIQAAAPTGINGTITNTAPQLNIVGALAGLNTPQLDLNRVGHDPCSSTVQQSTMKKLGKGGIPFFNKGQDSYTLDRLLPNKQDKSSQTTNLSQVKPVIHDCQPKTKHPRPQDVTKQAG